MECVDLLCICMQKISVEKTKGVGSCNRVGHAAAARQAPGCSQYKCAAQGTAEFAIIAPMSEHNDCPDGSCATRGPSPFANTPPIGLPPELQDKGDELVDWKKIAPDLHEDAYATADALWWARHLGESTARGEDVITLLRGPDDARAVQRALAQAYHWWPADRAPRYWKSGGPSMDKLVHAPLPEPGVHLNLDVAPAPQTVFQLRGAEAEIAFRVGSEVTLQAAQALDDAAAWALIDAWCISLEWVDVRWREGLKAPALAQLADGQCHGGLSLGAWQPVERLQGVDWAQQQCTITLNGEAPQTFTGSHSLGSPAALLRAWLVHVAEQYGSVPAGTVVTTGTWCGCMQLAAGTRFHAEFAGLGALTWQF